ALDVPSRAALLPDLQTQLAAAGATAVLVTHDLHEALALGSRMGLLVEGRLVQEGSAAAVMARPASDAAARLLGVENLLPGRVLGSDGGGWRVSLDGSGSALRAASAAFAPVPGDRVLLALRAGAIRLLTTEPPPGWNGLPGHVREARLAAGGHRVAVDAGRILEVVLPWESGAHLPSAGTTVVVAFPPEAAHLLPARPPRPEVPAPPAGRRWTRR
ncbi:MAG: TOBE domain-containing protein, partial [Thermomicrobiales bacterium]|nr:TOBE domain-containing protein [Thermomicrobiales bacterium]